MPFEWRKSKACRIYTAIQRTFSELRGWFVRELVNSSRLGPRGSNSKPRYVLPCNDTVKTRSGWRTQYLLECVHRERATSSRSTAAFSLRVALAVPIFKTLNMPLGDVSGLLRVGHRRRVLAIFAEPGRCGSPVAEFDLGGVAFADDSTGSDWAR